MSSSVRCLTRSPATYRLHALCVWLAVASASLTGCGPRFVPAPDSPMLVLEARGKLRVAMDDGGKLVEVGWIDAAEIKGQTVVHYDWTQP